jgi:hypothetical protein
MLKHNEKLQPNVLHVVILHWHKRCPKCGVDSCFYVDFYRGKYGCKLPSGFFECENCHELIGEDVFALLPELHIRCPEMLKRNRQKETEKFE